MTVIDITDKKSCGFCKHFNLDGMFGRWCSIYNMDWRNIDANECCYYEKG